MTFSEHECSVLYTAIKYYAENGISESSIRHKNETHDLMNKLFPLRKDNGIIPGYRVED
jgi:hypothetical protein